MEQQMSDSPQKEDKSIEDVEQLLQKMTDDYQEMLVKLSDFKEERQLHKVKKMAKEMSENLLKVQASMHAIIDGFVSTEEPELVDQSIFPELCKDLPEIKKELYSKYIERIDKCCSSYKPNPFV